MQTTGQPRSSAAGDRRVPGLPVPAARADRAAGGLHARQLRDEAAARRPDRDHAPARARGAAADRAAQRAAVPDLPPGGGALHAEDARDPARGLPATAGAAGARAAAAAGGRGAGARRAGAGGGGCGAAAAAGAGARAGSARALLSRALVGGDRVALVVAPLTADQQVAG